mgnify:CR=1 FL=1
MEEVLKLGGELLEPKGAGLATLAAATAASNALPPALRISAPASAARDCGATTMPLKIPTSHGVLPHEVPVVGRINLPAGGGR